MVGGYIAINVAKTLAIYAMPPMIICNSPIPATVATTATLNLTLMIVKLENLAPVTSSQLEIAFVAQRQ